MKPTLATNQIHNQCCIEGMKQLPDESIDLVITSPPYDAIRDYHNNDEWNHHKFQQVATELGRVIKPGGVIVWNVNDQVINGSKTGSSFRQALYFKDTLNLNLHDTMIYEKVGIAFASGPNSTRYTQKFEFVFIISKGRPKSINLIQDKPNKWAGTQSWGKTGGRNTAGEVLKYKDKSNPVKEFGVRNNIWLIKNSGGHGQSNKEAYQHPATMPEELARGHIISWSNPGDIVLDPFLGSGTTARMAEQEGRQYIGYEIDEEYANLAKRLMNTKPRLL